MMHVLGKTGNFLLDSVEENFKGKGFHLTLNKLNLKRSKLTRAE